MLPSLSVLLFLCFSDNTFLINLTLKGIRRHTHIHTGTCTYTCVYIRKIKTYTVWYLREQFSEHFSYCFESHTMSQSY